MAQQIMEAYLALLAEKKFQHSDSQLKVIEKLQEFERKTFSSYQGLYIYGEVGRGKSFLVDIYFQHTDIRRKQRWHFHSFMQEIHQQMRALQNVKDPLWLIGKKMSKQVKLLFLDELHVHDIGDAMILSRLFAALFANKVMIVTTSNYHPDDLYKDGLQRENFLPAINLLKQKMQIIAIGGETDYRLMDQSMRQYFVNDAGGLHKLFLEKAQGEDIVPYTLQIANRSIIFQNTTSNVIWCTFSELCLQPFWVAEYQSLIKQFKIIFITDIPHITDRNSMKRFIALVDELYESKVQLFCSAAALPALLCSHVEFQRTASRLTEMCK